MFCLHCIRTSINGCNVITNSLWFLVMYTILNINVNYTIISNNNQKAYLNIVACFFVLVNMEECKKLMRYCG